MERGPKSASTSWMAFPTTVTIVLCTACAFDLASVSYTSAVFQPSQLPSPTLVLSEDISLTDTPCYYARTLRKTTRWDQVGTIPEGDVLRSKDQVLTVECSNVHEAYLVMSGSKLIGFFLPVERGFIPYSSPLELPGTLTQ
jgi:hypothetical protein